MEITQEYTAGGRDSVANFGAILSENCITLGEGIRADDGFLDVCVFTPRSLFDAIRIMWRLMIGDFSRTASMSYHRGCTDSRG